MFLKSDSTNQLETLAAAVDVQEADAVYVVGGDGTLCRFITGIFRNRGNSVLPIGVFPGGYDNLSLKKLVPDSSIDVRKMCESAMALIEDERQNVNVLELSVEGTELDKKPFYTVGDVGVGWFHHIEERRRKFWYLGPLKRHWAYLWEMLKRSPSDMEAKLHYEEVCSGCRTCRPAVLLEQPACRWWHFLIGSPRYTGQNSMFSTINIYKKDYSKIENENCGRKREVDLKGTDLVIENNHLKKFIHRLYVSSDHVNENFDGKRINIKSGDHQVEIFLPRSIRVDVNSL
ncbi:hypothetical protein DICVIV_03441 [Dictyocaulus viviparus]|uniref:DAGKc domain-containing protein n=1 Tax=Dictyocaulus viviparus TaxID=29172 RepID=A0A0D8Y165_DICVI|nr:hypothetical protein DICVIV_03441 [Dictyocaulus viviparus]